MEQQRPSYKRIPYLEDRRRAQILTQLFKPEEKVEDFTALLTFKDDKEATAFGNCIFKCRRHKLLHQENRFWLIALARCGVKGERAKMISQTAMGVAVPEFYGGAGVSKDGHQTSPNI